MGRLFSVPATGRESSDRSRSNARSSKYNKDEDYRVEIVQSNDSNRSASSAYNLRTKRE